MIGANLVEDDSRKAVQIGSDSGLQLEVVISGSGVCSKTRSNEIGDSSKLVGWDVVP
jgi:hypothetical protein